MKQKDVERAPPSTLMGHEEQLMADVGKKKVNVLPYYVKAKTWLKQNRGDVNDRIMR
jgi:hypothetical protein